MNRKRPSPKKMKIIESSFSSNKKIKRISNISVKKNNKDKGFFDTQPKIITSNNNLVQYRNNHGLYKQFSMKENESSKETKKDKLSVSLKKELKQHAFKFPSKFTITNNNTIEGDSITEEKKQIDNTNYKSEISYNRVKDIKGLIEIGKKDIHVIEEKSQEKSNKKQGLNENESNSNNKNDEVKTKIKQKISTHNSLKNTLNNSSKKLAEKKLSNSNLSSIQRSNTKEEMTSDTNRIIKQNSNYIKKKNFEGLSSSNNQHMNYSFLQQRNNSAFLRRIQTSTEKYYDGKSPTKRVIIRSNKLNRRKSSKKLNKNESDKYLEVIKIYSASSIKKDYNSNNNKDKETSKPKSNKHSNSNISNINSQTMNIKEQHIQNSSQDKSINEGKKKENGIKEVSCINDEKKNNLPPKTTQITFKIKSNWGNLSQLSFISISFFGEENNKIPIIKSSINHKKEYSSKYRPGEEKIIYFYIDSSIELKKISISNGFNDTGMSIIEIIKDNDTRYPIWKGFIPRSNNLKPHIINLNSKINLQRENKFFEGNSNLAKKYSYRLISKGYGSLLKCNTFMSNPISSNEKELSIKQKLRYEQNSQHKKGTSNIISIKDTSHNNEQQGYNNKNNVNLTNSENSQFLCNKLRLNIYSNYGNPNFIGLSGIELYDNQKLIPNKFFVQNIKISNGSFGWKCQENTLENLLNNKNDKNNKKFMFLVNFNTSSLSLNGISIDINFINKVHINRIKIFNYNDPKNLDAAVKEISINLFKNNIAIYNTNKIFLMIPPGEDGIDFSQTFEIPYTSNIEEKYAKILDELNFNCNFINKKLKSLDSIEISKKNNTPFFAGMNVDIFNEKINYFCPKLPSGFTIKIQILSIYGEDYFQLDGIQIFNHKFEDITKEAVKIYLMPEKTLIKNQRCEGNDKNIQNGQSCLICNNMPYIKGKYLNFNKKNFNEINGHNRILFMFSEGVCVSKIILANPTNETQINYGVKNFQIFMDQNIICEGFCEKGNNCNEFKFSEPPEEDELVIIEKKSEEMPLWTYNKTESLYHLERTQNAQILSLRKDTKL